MDDTALATVMSKSSDSVLVLFKKISNYCGWHGIGNSSVLVYGHGQCTCTLKEDLYLLWMTRHWQQFCPSLLYSVLVLLKKISSYCGWLQRHRVSIMRHCVYSYTSVSCIIISPFYIHNGAKDCELVWSFIKIIFNICFSHYKILQIFP